MPDQIAPHLEGRIVAFSLAHPVYGPRRIGAELARENWGGIRISEHGVWRVLLVQRRTCPRPVAGRTASDRGVAPVVASGAPGPGSAAAEARAAIPTDVRVASIASVHGNAGFQSTGELRA